MNTGMRRIIGVGNVRKSLSGYNFSVPALTQARSDLGSKVPHKNMRLLTLKNDREQIILVFGDPGRDSPATRRASAIRSQSRACM